jgi:OFA family oxalate/formate antiporter-like MFS transporter
LADRNPLKPFLILMLISFLLGAFGLAHLARDWGYWLLAIGFGAGGGLWGVLSNLAFVRYFGTKHLGEVSGLNTALTVSASAIGPAAFSLGLDGSGSYLLPVYLCMVALVLLLVWAVIYPAPERTMGNYQG